MMQNEFLKETDIAQASVKKGRRKGERL